MSSGLPRRLTSVASFCACSSSGFSTSAAANFVGTMPAPRGAGSMSQAGRDACTGKQGGGPTPCRQGQSSDDLGGPMPAGSGHRPASVICMMLTCAGAHHMQHRTMQSWRSSMIWKFCKTSLGICQGTFHAVSRSGLPGATQLTLMPCWPSSSARAFVNARSAVLLTARSMSGIRLQQKQPCDPRDSAVSAADGKVQLQCSQTTSSQCNEKHVQAPQACVLETALAWCSTTKTDAIRLAGSSSTCLHTCGQMWWDRLALSHCLEASNITTEAVSCHCGLHTSTW